MFVHSSTSTLVSTYSKVVPKTALFISLKKPFLSLFFALTSIYVGHQPGGLIRTHRSMTSLFKISIEFLAKGVLYIKKLNTRSMLFDRRFIHKVLS